jgi:hypothetical protein
MPVKSPSPDNKGSVDRIVKELLSRVGESIDRLLGRNWQPASSIATSELVERLRTLIDREVRDYGSEGRFAPHVIRLKVDWDRFSSDSDEPLAKLGRELTVAVVDHINDNRYHTYGPIDLKVKADYFTEGVRLTAGFGGVYEEDAELEVTLDRTAPDEASASAEPESEATSDSAFRAASPDLPTPAVRLVTVRIGETARTLTFPSKARLMIGRGPENDLVMDDASVSGTHAAMVFDGDGRLLLSDLGSTNGTVVAGQPVGPGTAVEVTPGCEVMFGECAVVFEFGEGFE